MSKGCQPGMRSDFGPLDDAVISVGRHSMRLVEQAVLLRFYRVEGLLEGLAETLTSRKTWSGELRKMLGSS